MLRKLEKVRESVEYYAENLHIVFLKFLNFPSYSYRDLCALCVYCFVWLPRKKILNTCFVFGMFDLGVFLFWVKEVWKFLFKERTRFGIVIGVVDELGSELKLTVIFFFFGY